MDANQLRDEGRVRAIRIAPPALLGLCTKRDDPLTLRVLDEVPPDAVLVGVHYDPIEDAVCLFVGHESFAPTPFATSIPIQSVTFQREVGADTALANLARDLTARKDKSAEAGLEFFESFRGWNCPCCYPLARGQGDDYYVRHSEGCPLAAALALVPKE